jgi:zinc transporter 9
VTKAPPLDRGVPDQPADIPDSTSNTVILAFAGNSVITVLKFGVWLRTGSSAMLAEALHTLVDTANQGLLWLGLRQSSGVPDSRHPYGYGRAAYFWGLVSALGLFWCGAGVSVFHGLETLVHPPQELSSGVETWFVLGASLCIDGYVLV